MYSPLITNVLALPILGLLLIGSLVPLIVESFHSPPGTPRPHSNGIGLRP